MADNASVLVRMKQPCWQNLLHKPCGQGTSRVVYIENVGVDQLQPGNWYLDWPSKVLSYKPTAEDETNQLRSRLLDRTAMRRAASSMAADEVGVPLEAAAVEEAAADDAAAIDAAAIDAVLPISDGLIHAAEGLSHLTFTNLTFEHDGWTAPNGPEGYVEQQSGALIRSGPGVPPPTCEACWLWTPPNGSLHFEQPRNVSFAGCTFRHLGSASAVSLMGGAHGNTLSACHFYDLSGSAVQIGRNDKFAPDTRTAERELDNTLRDSLVEWAANEYHGAVGVQVSHAQRTTIDQVELRNLSYGGLSVGWGWARHARPKGHGTYSSDNAVTRNKVHSFKTLLGDGGGIYALGPQPRSIMRANWVHTMAAGRGGGGFYPDEGSTDWQITQSVFSDAQHCADRCEWLHIWTSSIRDILVDGAWTDTQVYRDDGTNCTVQNISVVAAGAFSPAAHAVMAEAGTRSTFVPWARPPVPPPPLWLPRATATRGPVDGVLTEAPRGGRYAS